MPHNQNHHDYEELDTRFKAFLGSKVDQQKAITTINRSIDDQEAALHLISGGSLCGKTNGVIRPVMQGLKKKGYKRIKAFDDEEIIEDPVIERLEESFQALHEDAWDDTEIYRSKDGRHYVIQTREEFNFGYAKPGTEPASAKMLRLAEQVQALADEDIHVTLLADVPLHQVKPPYLRQPASAEDEKKALNDALKTMHADCPGMAHNHTIGYDTKAIRSAFKESCKAGDADTFFTYLEGKNLGDRRVEEWNALKSAALALQNAGKGEAARKTEKAFDAAFDALVTAMGGHQGGRKAG